MRREFRILIGISIIGLTLGSSIALGILLPLKSQDIMEEINDDLLDFSQINLKDFDPYIGSDSNYSDFMYMDASSNDSNFSFQTKFEFFNVSDRNAYLDYNTRISYMYVPGELVFDTYQVRYVKEYNFEEGYFVYATKKLYLLNTDSNISLKGTEKVLNFNYMWPYYVKNFGNGTEYGFQAYIAAFLIQQELNQTEGYDESDLAYLVLNQNYAEAEGMISLSTYLPHNWLGVRPAYIYPQFDRPTSYRILYNAIYNGHDYSVLTGEPGSPKFFLDLIQGLYYDSSVLSVDVVQLLADIYGIDTVPELEYAKSFAAYMKFLLGQPSLDWLYGNGISYICKRTTLEWIIGIEDPLFGGKRFPLISNDTIEIETDWETELHYVANTGSNNITKVALLIGIANIPSFEGAYSTEIIVDEERNLAYVIEDNIGVKIVDLNSSLFMAVAEYSDFEFDKGIVEAITYSGNFVFVAEGESGLEVLDTSNLVDVKTVYQSELSEVSKDMRDVAMAEGPSPDNYTILAVANGEHGLALFEFANGELANSNTFDISQGIAQDITIYGDYAIVGLGENGIVVLDISSPNSVSELSYYNITNDGDLNNVLELKAYDDVLYIIDEDEGLIIYDISFGFLFKRGKLANSGGEIYQNLQIAGSNDIYLTRGTAGFVHVDVTVSDFPIIVGTFDETDGLKSSAESIYVVGSDIYLADLEQGIVHIVNITATEYEVVRRDVIHTYVECWKSYNKVQFSNWQFKNYEWIDTVTDTYDFFNLYNNVERGLRLQWSEQYFRPFIFSSLRDTGLFKDEIAFVYQAEAQIPYLQLDTYDLYGQEYADFIPSTFVHVGIWDKMYPELDLTINDFNLTHSFPGRLRDEFHMQYMSVEPISGSVVEKRDRVQFNTRVSQYDEEIYSLLADTVPITQLAFYYYNTWHSTYAGMTADMAELYWQEDVILGTFTLSDKLKEDFLNKIDLADAFRTSGAFSAMFVIALGFVATSVVLHKTKMKPKIK